MKILLINGPNLQLLGFREPGIYGRDTLESIVSHLRELAAGFGCELIDFQSNHEGEIVDRIGNSISEGISGIVMNPAAYTHTSVAIRDAIAAVKLPVVEVHLSNVHAREEFRSRSLTAPVCIGVVAGFGADSYELALRALCSHLKKRNQQ
ncbi:type II 3-dehydroquinate dehydratase [uncultured Victivallis sp.]|uniref:type II 3-dehydroquinate dehydratase n=1 Tax=uncultured Victivallis sp. TaxID=354118 RepID=UPI0025F4E5DA|nr:type II 3-dehydroquinate dehydratase [uncultured Victivallis sp.]